MTIPAKQRHLPLRAPLLASALTLGVAGGCDQTCEGAGCEEQFAGTIVSVLRGADQPTRGVHSPLEAWATLAGDKEQGPQADIALLTGGAWVGTADESRVRAFDLSAGGPLTLGLDAALTLAGEQDGDAFGAALAVLPDWDGDGVAELGVGAPRRDAGEQSRDEGSIYLYSGLGERLDGETTALLRVSGEGVGGRFGSVLRACGDLDGDGIGDIAASAPWDSEAADFAGRVWVGLSSRAPAAGSAVLADEIGLSWTGAARGDRAGDALLCQHDLIGPDGGAPDGIADLVVGAPFAAGVAGDATGRIYVLAGGAALEGGTLAERAALTLEGPAANAWLGWSLATGDLDGDGAADLAGGAPGVLGEGETDARGQVFAWDAEDLQTGAAARAAVLGQTEGDAFGRALALADLDADGHDDLLVGAPRRDPSEELGTAYGAGTLYVLRGRADWSGWSVALGAEDAELRYATEQPYLRTGQTIRVGDLDADGVADLALGQRYDPDRGLPE